MTCAYCEGEGKVHHHGPPGISAAFWSRATDGEGKCPVCRGKGTIRSDYRWQLGMTGILFMSNSAGKVYASCPSCPKWVNVTDPFFKRGGRASCVNGHELVIEVEPGNG